MQSEQWDIFEDCHLPQGILHCGQNATSKNVNTIIYFQMNMWIPNEVPATQQCYKNYYYILAKGV